jgi:hypothetical protein
VKSSKRFPHSKFPFTVHTHLDYPIEHKHPPGVCYREIEEDPGADTAYAKVS